ncbi:formate hydrogenase [Thermoplasma volcanium GSS1]|uniref:Formate hydrogenase n=1 Tax=Thermoplasma volcanium (strain ATCC 51530 / DSM 4299 / JCM 9571 / NBRC 15438 / GSS1) TaxID=273116 RepID=Q97C62_THEVO|nr:formate dehydrogenase subunit alpha [Thermoplasma volcanium]BAB59385.1 formate hydrogenase [Thermoplasma volcanium GSS1]
MEVGEVIEFYAGSKSLKGEKNQTILQALLLNGIDIPHICYHPSLGPINTCDTCLVDMNGKIVRSCSTYLEQGAKIDYNSNRVLELQREAVQRMLHNHDLYCTVCDNNNGDCPLHNAVHDLEIDNQKYPYEPKPYPVDDSNPFYVYDPNQCILCGRCVEACQDVQVNETLSIDWSRERPRVVWDNDVPINESSCVSCGHCVTVCPVNALMEKTMLGKAGFLTGLEKNTKQKMIDVVKSIEPEITMSPIMAISNIESKMRSSRIKKTKTVCTYCGVGCSFEMWTMGREILKVQPQPESPANGISTCIKGKFGWDFVNSKERLTSPLIRDGERFRRATWEEALDLVAKKLREIKDKYGGDAIEFIASSKGTNEEAYLMQKLARQVFGTNNVDNSSRFCQAPATTGLWRTVGYGGDSGSIQDIYMADLVIAIGTNTAESHPVLATRVKRAHKLNGQKLIVSDLRMHEMARRADLFLHPKPGTDIVWLSAVTKYILDKGWEDKSFIRERVSGFEDYVKSLEPFTMEFAEEATGISKETLMKVANMIHEAKNMVILWAMGVTQHQAGSDTSTAISNLLLITGNYGRHGTGAYPLRGHNNVQGASDFGAMNAYLPGYQPVSDPTVRKKFEDAWHCTIPEKPGLDNNTCLEGIMNGKIRAMYVVGEELVETGSDSNFIRDQLEKLDFLVVEDLFLSETAKYADVVLPASASLEKEGTFVNTERRIQRIYEVMAPLPGTRPDWQIIQDIANRLGARWNYGHPSEIMEEAASLSPIFAGVRYELLEGFKSLQWPVRSDGKDSPLLYEKEFNFPDGKARLYPLKYNPPLSSGLEFDLHLNNGRLLEHFHEGNETYKSPGIRSKVPGTFVEVSPDLAKERGLETGDLVRITSEYGSIKVSVLVSDRVSGKELYMPMNASGDSAVNLLTGRLMDPTAHTPAYKEVSVRLEKITGKRGPPPLPSTNPRNAIPHPQIGVQVEKKWARKDYVKLTTE